MAGIDFTLISHVRNSKWGLGTPEIAERLGLSLQQLGPVLERLLLEEKLVSLKGWWVLPGQLSTIREQLLTALDAFHAHSPKALGVSPTEIAKRAELPIPLEGLVRMLEREGEVAMRDGLLRRSGHRAKVSPRRAMFLDAVVELIGSQGLTPPSPYQLSLELHAPLEAVQDNLAEATLQGRLVKLGEEVYFTPDQVRSALAAFRQAFGTRSFRPAEVRQRLAISRKYSDAILAFMDAEELVTHTPEGRRLAR